jgi:hypothetical protein
MIGQSMVNDGPTIGYWAADARARNGEPASMWEGGVEIALL